MNTSYSPAKWPRFTLAGFAFFLINTFVVPIAANAQCGYIEGLGCPGTNYSNYGSASNHDAASIEYDNFISAFHTSILRDPEGGFRIWGENTAPNGKSVLWIPTPIDAFHFPLIKARPLKAAMGSKAHRNVQSFVLTADDKLWVWGKRGAVLHAAVTKSDSMQSIILPRGIHAMDVKTLFATTEALAMLTCNGDVYVMAQHESMRGQSTLTSFNSWTRVRTGAGAKAKTLDNIIVLRGSASGFIALDSEGQLWTWGRSTYLGDNNPAQSRAFAEKMILPSNSGSIKMVGATGSLTAGEITYYVLYGDGRLFALGNGMGGQLGNWSIGNSNTWIQPRYAVSEESVMNNIQWFSPNEHDYKYPFVNVITRDSTLYNWGLESGYALGRRVHGLTNSAKATNPGIPPSLQGMKIVAVESGCHTTVVDAQCMGTYGYVGHQVEGSLGDGTDEGEVHQDFVFGNSYLQTCGALTAPVISVDDDYMKGTHGKICTNQTVHINAAPGNGVLSINTEPVGIAQLNGNNLEIQGVGDISLNYHVQDFQSCDSALSVTIKLETETCTINAVRGTVWIDDDLDAIKDQAESQSIGSYGSNTGLWANLIEASGVVYNSVPVNPNGTFEIITAQKGTFSVQVTKSKVIVGSIVRSSDKILPEGWKYTGNNHSNNSICKVPDCTDPSVFSNLVLGNNDINGINFGIIGAYSLLGRVFHDADGLNKNGVNGNPVYPSSSYVQQGLPPLFVCAVDKKGKVANYTSVRNDGTYQINIPIKQDITLLLTTTLPTIGGPSPLPSLPSGWTFVGETFGTNNTLGSGNNDGSGSGANSPMTRYDGKVSINIQGNESSVGEVDFGIQQLPGADPKSYSINISDFSSIPPNGYPIITNFKAITMSSPKLKESGNNSNGSLSGSDPEDCAAAGTCNGNQGGIRATFTIGTIHSNTRLYYDFGGTVGIREILANSVISNFNADKMVIYGQDGEGNTHNPFGFEYTITDKAGTNGVFVTYGIQLNAPLPLNLLSFDVVRKEAAAYLSWTSLDERQFRGFEVLRSTDGRIWTTVTFVPSNGISGARQDYFFIDHKPAEGLNLYKLKMIDQDEKYQYSDIRSVTFNIKNHASVYPNPTDGHLNITGLSGNETIRVFDLTGKVLMKVDAKDQQGGMSLTGYSAGTYFVHITYVDGKTEIIKVEKIK